MSYSVRFPAPKPRKGKLSRASKRFMVGPKTRLESFTLREIDGSDEEYVATRAKALGDETNLGEEMIRISIVAVNDEPVQQPYSLKTWNAPARALLATAWRELNAVTPEEEDDFLSEAVGDDGEDPPAK